MEKLNELIKNARESKGISQRELARRINVNNAVIARIENGETKKPSFQLLKTLSSELNIGLYKMLKSANYTDEEIDNLGYIELTTFDGIDTTQVIEDYMLADYLIDNSKEGQFIDIVKVLNGYKENKLDLSAVFFLICFATGGIDLTKYIPADIRGQYAINASISRHIKRKKSSEEEL